MLLKKNSFKQLPRRLEQAMLEERNRVWDVMNFSILYIR